MVCMYVCMYVGGLKKGSGKGKERKGKGKEEYL